MTQEKQKKICKVINKQWMLFKNREAYVRMQIRLFTILCNAFDLVDYHPDFLKHNYEKSKTLTSAEMLELLFDEEMVGYIISETSKCALQKSLPNPQTSKAEMRCFIAILILSGYNWLPGRNIIDNETINPGDEYKFLNELSADKLNLPHKPYCDHLFTCSHLLVNVNDRDLIGTIRETLFPNTAL